jgi:uncharacterized protein with HEPN domain
MPSDPDAIRRSLHDIRHHLALAQTFVEGMIYEALRDDLRTTYAVTRCVEIISEASRRLPDELKARHPSIARKNMAGAGNVYRHDYEDMTASFVGRAARSSAVAAHRDRARTGSSRRPMKCGYA